MCTFSVVLDFKLTPVGENNCLVYDAFVEIQGY